MHVALLGITSLSLSVDGGLEIGGQRITQPQRCHSLHSCAPTGIRTLEGEIKKHIYAHLVKISGIHYPSVN